MKEHYYHFESDKWMRYVQEHGLVPHRGKNSQLSGNHSDSVYYSCGAIGVIIMYMGFRESFDYWKSSEGLETLSYYKGVISRGKITCKHEEYILQARIEKISQLVQYENFDDYMEPGPILEILELNQKNVAAGKDNNYPADCVIHNSIPPEQLRVLALRSKDGTKVLTDMKSIILYFLCILHTAY